MSALGRVAATIPIPVYARGGAARPVAASRGPAQLVLELPLGNEKAVASLMSATASPRVCSERTTLAP